jgi:hypothetical protein
MTDESMFEPLSLPGDSAAAGRWPDPALEQFERERAALEADIAEAKARAAAAKELASAREASLKATLRGDVIAAQDAVAEMEREHQRAVAMVRENARLEAEAIVADAKRTANALLLESGTEREGAE